MADKDKKTNEEDKARNEAASGVGEGRVSGVQGTSEHIHKDAKKKREKKDINFKMTHAMELAYAELSNNIERMQNQVMQMDDKFAVLVEQANQTLDSLETKKTSVDELLEVQKAELVQLKLDLKNGDYYNDEREDHLVQIELKEAEVRNTETIRDFYEETITSTRETLDTTKEEIRSSREQLAALSDKKGLAILSGDPEGKLASLKEETTRLEEKIQGAQETLEATIKHAQLAEIKLDYSSNLKEESLECGIDIAHEKAKIISIDAKTTAIFALMISTSDNAGNKDALKSFKSLAETANINEAETTSLVKAISDTHSTTPTIEDTLTTENERKKNDRLLERQTAEEMNGNQVLFFLLSLFLGLGNDKGLNNNEALSKLANALSINENKFVDTINSYKSGKSSLFNAAITTRSNMNLSKADFSRAETIVSKYAETGNPLLELIALKESGGDYNIVYGGKRIKATEMSVNDVIAWQKNYTQNQGSPSSAVGKYQIIRKTLTGLKSELGLTGKEIFDEKMQDRMANALLNRRGYDDYKSGNISEMAFMKNISKEWASMPKDAGGRSYYAGDGLNKAHATPATLVLAMRHAKDFDLDTKSTLQKQFAKGGIDKTAIIARAEAKVEKDLSAAFKDKSTEEIAVAAVAREVKIATDAAAKQIAALDKTDDPELKDPTNTATMKS